MIMVAGNVIGQQKAECFLATKWMENNVGDWSCIEMLLLTLTWMSCWTNPNSAYP